MRIFHLVRSEDLSGVSGVGVVAEGVEFDTGKVAICWLTKYHSVSVFDNIHVLEMVHGHEGRTKVVWLEQGASGA